eukprot:355359-Chlamydomonas_euryale.AAC.8
MQAPSEHLRSHRPHALLHFGVPGPAIPTAPCSALPSPRAHAHHIRATPCKQLQPRPRIRRPAEPG